MTADERHLRVPWRGPLSESSELGAQEEVGLPRRPKDHGGADLSGGRKVPWGRSDAGKDRRNMERGRSAIEGRDEFRRHRHLDKNGTYSQVGTGPAPSSREKSRRLADCGVDGEEARTRATLGYSRGFRREGRATTSASDEDGPFRRARRFQPPEEIRANDELPRLRRRTVKDVDDASPERMRHCRPPSPPPGRRTRLAFARGIGRLASEAGRRVLGCPR